MRNGRYTMSDYDVFWDNGRWVAVRTGPDGGRRNVAPNNCERRADAVAAAREDRDDLNDGDGEQED